MRINGIHALLLAGCLLCAGCLSPRSIDPQRYPLLPGKTHRSGCFLQMLSCSMALGTAVPPSWPVSKPEHPDVQKVQSGCGGLEMRMSRLRHRGIAQTEKNENVPLASEKPTSQFQQLCGRHTRTRSRSEAVDIREGFSKAGRRMEFSPCRSMGIFVYRSLITTAAKFEFYFGWARVGKILAIKNELARTTSKKLSPSLSPTDTIPATRGLTKK